MRPVLLMVMFLVKKTKFTYYRTSNLGRVNGKLGKNEVATWEHSDLKGFG